MEPDKISCDNDYLLFCNQMMQQFNNSEEKFIYLNEYASKSVSGIFLSLPLSLTLTNNLSICCIAP